ncbi:MULTISPECIES: hypothetical protein [Pseudidiomarina]|uniref:Uncharacterized protein n=2 Tax=Pseudidiomarina TaxID=2800384 RepID=A0A368UY83_9GAMM|nr:MULTISPECIES: hypothetical protein [Pseudidiomarina]PWW14218.1 hypothetical protein DET45_104157 [Pseudidiomarina maritima]RBP92032.1 hypothetical protein DFO81_103157 [Pseudidiomarina tainanensis]RCW33796.1 hypothetical protein DFO79_104177 [Pseudidiomarina tainanensis]
MKIYVTDDFAHFMHKAKIDDAALIVAATELSQGLHDGSAVSMNIYGKPPGKSALSIEHSKLESEAQVEHWRGWWKAVLKGL